MTARRLLVVVGLATASAACAASDGDAALLEIAIDSAEASLGELERPWNIVELPDGRVLLAQRGTPAVLRIDLDAGLVDTIGRKGQGPGEYERPTWVRVHAGGIAVLDAGLRRVVHWDAAGKPIGTEPVPSAASWRPQFDSAGRIYAEQLPAGITFGGGAPDSTRAKDSTAIYRMTLPGPAYDTVATVYDRGAERIEIGDGLMFVRQLYETRDVWGVFPDGTVWIARGHENRVDRRSPGGVWTVGAARPFEPVRTTDADRQKLDAFPGAAPTPDTMYRPMADVKGPFAEAVAAPDGEVWTRMHQPTGAVRERYAIFPVRGPSVRTVTLPLGRAVLAISERHLYAVHEDADGFQVLERYVRP